MKHATNKHTIIYKEATLNMVDETELEQPSTAPVQNQDEQALQSSSADSETENELLSVVQSAITEDDVEETDSQSDEVEYDEEDETLEAVSDEDTEADESFEDVPFNKHPRFQQLIMKRIMPNMVISNLSKSLII